MKKAIIIFIIFLTSGVCFSQTSFSLKKEFAIKGTTINHWWTAEINQDYLHNKTTVMLVPFVNKATRLLTTGNGFREYTKIVILDTCGLGKVALKALIQKPKWVKNPPPAKDSTQTNFFYTAIDD